jgi:hypothetical protein
MARKKTETGDVPIGDRLSEVFYRLGYGGKVLYHEHIAKLIKARTGHQISRQRVASIFNAIRVSEDTIKTLADAAGLTPGQLVGKEPLPDPLPPYVDPKTLKGSEPEVGKKSKRGKK